jgi:hypothetical protein
MQKNSSLAYTAILTRSKKHNYEISFSRTHEVGSSVAKYLGVEVIT